MMRKLLLGTCASIGLLCVSAGAFADQVSEVFTCRLEEGKTIEDALTANKKWLAWMRAEVNENITSSAGTAVVGDQDGFLFVDTYPSLETWAAAKTALDSDEGEALESVFEGVMECKGNRLWRIRPTE